MLTLPDHELIDVETVLAVADTVSGLRDGLQAGIGVSGPAARFAIKTAVGGPVFAGKAITATTARRLLANENAMMYDNPQALLLCHYKRDQALCHREAARDTPSPHRCVPGCANVIRTDHHARQLRGRADALDSKPLTHRSRSPPGSAPPPGNSAVRPTSTTGPGPSCPEQTCEPRTRRARAHHRRDDAHLVRLPRALERRADHPRPGAGDRSPPKCPDPAPPGPEKPVLRTRQGTWCHSRR